MDINNCYKKIFNILTIEKMELSINSNLKKLGYIYFLDCVNRFSKIETTKENKQILENYLYEYIKIYIINNKYKFGRYEFLKNLELDKFQVIEKLIVNRLSKDELIKLVDSFLKNKCDIISIFKFIENNEKIVTNIDNSEYWFTDNYISNIKETYLGKLIIIKNLNYKITNKLIIKKLCGWILKLIKLNDFDNCNIINIKYFIFFKKLINEKKYSEEFLNSLNKVELSNKIDNNIFIICYFFLKNGIINNINKFFELKKNIKLIDIKLSNIYTSNNIDNINRINVISELQFIKKDMKKLKKNIEVNLSNNNNIIKNYCIFICKLITIKLDKNIIKDYCSILINILKYFNNNDIYISNYIFDIFININNIEIEILCVEYIANYIQLFEFDKLDNKIINKLFNIFININTLKLNKYEFYEPRYYVLYLIKYINKYLSIDNYLLNNNEIFNKYIKIILNDLSELFFQIIYYLDELNNIYILDNENNENLVKYVKMIETFNIFFYENIDQLYLISNNINIVSKLDKYIYNKIIQILYHNIKKILLNLDEYIYIIDLYEINFNLFDLLVKVLLIIFNFNKNNKLLLHFYKLELEYKLLNEIKTILFENNIVSWIIYYKIIELQQMYDKYIKNHNISLNDKFIDPILFTEIVNPIILPNSNIILNYETIRQHLENSKTDPFDRTYLTLDLINEYNKQDHVKEIIEKFNKDKKNDKCS